MKKFIKIALFWAFLLSSLSASGYVNAVKVPGNVAHLTPESKAWLSASFSEVTLYPQTALKFFDKTANEMNANNKAKKVKIKALYDGSNLAFLIQWNDATKSVQTKESTTVYGDGFAFQFPQNYSDAKELPYIGMGSAKRAVIVHLAKATEGVYEPNGEADVYHQVNKGNQNLYNEELKAYEQAVAQKMQKQYQRDFISEGFRSMTQIRDNANQAFMQMSYKDGFWRGVLSRTLKDTYLDLSKGAFPVAIAVWDGEKKNRDGLKLLSSWIPVKLVGISGGDKLIEDLTTPVSGDVANGEKLALENCAACHHYKDQKIAPDFMAPNLSNIGGYATKEYIKESIENPNAVVVPGYNIKAHPNSAWYSLDEQGQRVSTMPAYDWMDEKSKNDLVAFFSSMKEEE